MIKRDRLSKVIRAFGEKRKGQPVWDLITDINVAICACECNKAWQEGDNFVEHGGNACKKCIGTGSHYWEDIESKSSKMPGFAPSRSTGAFAGASGMMPVAPGKGLMGAIERHKKIETEAIKRAIEGAKTEIEGIKRTKEIEGIRRAVGEMWAPKSSNPVPDPEDPEDEHK